MIKSILIAIVAAIAGFAGYVALQPAVGTVSRSAVIAAPATKIFPLVNNLKTWNDWSPWAKLDPNAKSTFEGPDSGVGAIFKWSGNGEIGEGAIAIVESAADERLKLRLDFAKPFASTSDVEFAFQPEGDGTRVTWTMTGERPFLARAICILFNADKMVGDMYEKGLANLGKLATAPSPA
ncbi:MAG: SRPBCC family protein [Hyphomicrobium sp.]